MKPWKKKLKNREPVIMGILNVTPDSFFDGGVYNTEEKIKKRIKEFINSGVDIIDIGAESTRPGATPINENEEIKRLLPVLKLIKNIANIPVSVDTYKPGVAKTCIQNGADIINDVYGLRKPGMLDVIVEYDIPVVIMHMKGEPGTMQENPLDFSQINEVTDFLKNAAYNAISAGISKENIILDPGIGFGKEPDLNIRLIAEAHRLTSLGYPVLIGASRKSLIGTILNKPAEKRMLGSVLVHMIAVLNGCLIIRSHDVEETAQMLKVFKAFKTKTINTI